jgi:hypothetical protein
MPFYSGSGGVAKILSRAEHSRSTHRLEGYVNLAATQYNRLCVAQHDWMKTDSKALLNAGAELVMRTWKLAEQTLDGWAKHEFDLILPHQVSKKQIETAARAMGLIYRKWGSFFFDRMGIWHQLLAARFRWPLRGRLQQDTMLP